MAVNSTLQHVGARTTRFYLFSLLNYLHWKPCMRQVKSFAAGDDSALELIRIQESGHERIGVCRGKWRHLLPKEPTAV